MRSLAANFLTREQVAEEFRGLAAACRQMLQPHRADIFDRLTVTVRFVCADIFEEHLQLFDDLRAVDCYEAMILAIGNSYLPASAEVFFRDFIASQTNPR